MDNTSNMGAPSNGTPKKTPRGGYSSVHAQQQRLLERLKIAPIDTITARRELDVMHPAARIMELRRRGYRIDTVWVDRQTDCGKVHCVALYVLQSGEANHD